MILTRYHISRYSRSISRPWLPAQRLTSSPLTPAGARQRLDRGEYFASLEGWPVLRNSYFERYFSLYCLFSFMHFSKLLTPGQISCQVSNLWTPSKHFQLRPNCFKVSNEVQDDLSSVVTVSLAQPSSLLCHVSLILSSGSELHVEEFWGAGDHTVTFRPPATQAEEWDLFDRGPRWAALKKTN